MQRVSQRPRTARRCCHLRNIAGNSFRSWQMMTCTCHILWPKTHWDYVKQVSVQLHAQSLKMSLSPSWDGPQRSTCALMTLMSQVVLLNFQWLQLCATALIRPCDDPIWWSRFSAEVMFKRVQAKCPALPRLAINKSVPRTKAMMAVEPSGQSCSMRKSSSNSW